MYHVPELLSPDSVAQNWMGMDRLGKAVDDGVHLNVTICGDIPSWSDLKYY